MGDVMGQDMAALVDQARVAVIVIGRNEGARLEASLRDLAGQGWRAVYVDSGSQDNSVAMARDLGVQVVELDDSAPFTAARGRNAGVTALAAQGPLPDFLQFIDGDCRMARDWLPAAITAMDRHPEAAIITGWRREISPFANAFHAMTEVEWHGPTGEIAACGGDMLVRSGAFMTAGGFNAALICSEDEDFVQRIRKTGAKALRLPVEMTFHDIALNRPGAWARRCLRAGHGFAEVGDIHPPHFAPERKRAMIYGLALPVLVGLAAITALWLQQAWIFWLALAAALALYGLSTWRVWRWLCTPARDPARVMSKGMALRVAGLFTLAKFPQAAGILRFYLRGGRSAAPRLIEYK